MMNENERFYIEYHPELGLNIDITAIIESVAPTEAYSLPEEILEALENPPCAVAGKAMDTLGKIDDVLDGLENHLANHVSNGISFQDYMNNRGEDGDPDIVREWEDLQSKSAKGSLEGEIYPILQSVRSNLVDNIKLLNDEVLVGDVEYDKIEDLCVAEKNKMENVVRNDIVKSDDNQLAQLKMNTELTDVVKDAVDGITDFVENAVELLSQNVDEVFQGVNEVLDHLSAAKPDDLARLSMLSNIGFAQKAKEGDDIKDRIDRVQATNSLLHEEVKTFRQMKADVGKALDWFESIDTDFEQNPITQLIDSNLESADTILDGYDDVVGDMHKTNQMQVMQLEDLVDNLQGKESFRQTSQVTDSIKKHFDYEDKDRTKQVQRFSQNMGYKKPKTLMSKKKTKRGLIR